MDSFLLEAHKKIVSSEIKQRNKEKKFLRKSANQDSISDTAYVSETVVVAPQLVIADTPQEEIPTVDLKVMHDIKAVNRYPENSYEDVHRMSLEILEEFEKTIPSGNDQSHVTSVKPDLEVSMEQDDEQESLDKNQIIEQGLIQELCGTFDTCSPISSDDNISSTNTKSSCNGSENMILGSAQHLSYLFDTAIKSGQQEILDWYNYSLEFESRVNALTADGRIKDKTARSKIYKEMKPFLPAKITQDNLRKKTLRARKHLTLFGKNGIGIDKIKLVSYSATEISKLTNAQIQNVIDQVKKYISDHQCHVTLKPVSSGNDQIKDEMSTSASVSSASQSKSDHSYFRNKILDQYPNLYRECSIENFDYYGITDAIICGDYICPLCKLGHDDEEIEDWHAKLSGLPSVLTDKIRSKLYKKYKKQTGNEPWQLSEAVIDMLAEPCFSASGQASDFKPITFEARPNPELIIKSVLEHFPYLKFRNSFRRIDNYDFTSPQP
ncbi:uncharacterized protein OCT59_024600 [Rhizophagus irregularis]|uniref:uncharacterized protein n=1 Tax=Rhizophagus irregularis TaxID=588596 RepID=UPI0033298FB0|nr:hypothetical protein OCT59_024600 [Rhizophagus irregularis]